MANDVTPNGIEYDYETAGPHGCRYYLLVDRRIHSEDKIRKAKSYIRQNFDAVRVTVEYKGE